MLTVSSRSRRCPLEISVLEQVEMIAVEFFPRQIFVVAIAECHGRTCQHVIDATRQSGLLGFGAAERFFQGAEHAVQPLSIRFGIALD